MKKMKRVHPVLAVLTLIVTLASSGHAFANSAGALLQLLRSRTGWALLTLTPEGAAFSSRALGRGVTHADDLEVLVSRLSEQERSASLLRFQNAADRIERASAGGRLRTSLLNRIASEELKLRKDVPEILFVKSSHATSFAANSGRFMRAGMTDSPVDFFSFYEGVHKYRKSLGANTPKRQQLDAIQKLGDLKLDTRTVKYLDKEDYLGTLVQPVDELSMVVLTAADLEVRKAALEAMIRYARHHALDRRTGIVDRWSREALEIIYHESKNSPEIREIALKEIQRSLD